MNFHKKLKSFFQSIFRLKELPPNTASCEGFLPKIVSPEERISRFITEKQKNNFNFNTNKIRAGAFTPPPNKRYSTYRTTDSQEKSIWEIATAHVTPNMPGQPKVLGRFDMEALSYLEENLKFDADGVPHYCHTNIVNWPDDEVKMQELKVELSQKSYSLIKKV